MRSILLICVALFLVLLSCTKTNNYKCDSDIRISKSFRLVEDTLIIDLLIVNNSNCEVFFPISIWNIVVLDNVRYDVNSRFSGPFQSIEIFDINDTLYRPGLDTSRQVFRHIPLFRRIPFCDSLNIVIYKKLEDKSVVNKSVVGCMMYWHYFWEYQIDSLASIFHSTFNSFLDENESKKIFISIDNYNENHRRGMINMTKLKDIDFSEDNYARLNSIRLNKIAFYDTIKLCDSTNEN